jgi:hypothetical protein
MTVVGVAPSWKTIPAISEDDVAAVAAEDHVVAVMSDQDERQGRAAGVDPVVAFLRVQHEVPVGAGLERDARRVVADAGVERRQGRERPRLALVGGIDMEDVALGAAPEGDAVEEIRRHRRAVADRAAGPAEHLDLDGRQHLRRPGDVGRRALDEHRGGVAALGERSRLVADHELVPAEPRVDVEIARNHVEMSAQEVEAEAGAVREQRGPVEIGLGRDEDPVVALIQADVGGVGERALDVEDVTALPRRAEAQGERVDAVVVDPVHTGRDRRAAAGEAGRVDEKQAGPGAVHHRAQQALELDVVDVAEAQHRDIVGEAVG